MPANNGFSQTKSLSHADLDQVIFSNKLGKDKGFESFWPEISKFFV